MGTMIADLHHTEIPELHVSISTHQVLGGPTRYLVNRYYGQTADGITIAWSQTERTSETDARAVANFFWTSALTAIRAHRLAAKVDPFEVVGEVLAEMTEDGAVELAPAPAAEPFKFEDRQLHEAGGEVYRVKISKTSGRPYGERLDSTPEGEAKPIWTYVSGAMRLLGPDTVMSTERRAELGRIMVHCLDCGAHLTHPISVARGIGPVCSGLGYSE